jgi:LEA14-like dessication related protein
MPTSRRRLLQGLMVLPLGLAGCALSPFADPLRAELVGLQSLPGEGLELRFLVRLRVQNPNDADLAYDGVAVDLDLRGARFASGVAPLQGRVPRFGEVVLAVPVTVSGLAMARQLLGLVREGEQQGRIGRVDYRLSGKLGGLGPLGSQAGRFVSEGSIDLAGL